jgi:hypothetical protein
MSFDASRHAVGPGAEQRRHNNELMTDGGAARLRSIILNRYAAHDVPLLASLTTPESAHG